MFVQRFQWPSKTLTRNPISQFLYLSRITNHTPSHDPYDPPFTPLSKPTKTTHKPLDKNKNSIVTVTRSTQQELGVSRKPSLNSDLPFHFRYTYSESNPAVDPIGYREPKRFSPFGPGRLDRKWTGTAALAPQEVDEEKVRVERNRILGDPLTDCEVEELVERYRHSDCSRQINLVKITLLLSRGISMKKQPFKDSCRKGGVTHNMLDDIHNHWKRAEAVRIKCMGVPTLDMDNVCFHLEDKSGGKVICRHKNVLLLYRGRNYDPKSRPVIPLMLWKPYAPIFPKLVKNIADGLTFEETKEMRDRGLKSLPLMKLTRNGVYVNVVERVREAFKTEEVLKLDCSYVGTSDCKRIGVKLRDLVPCIPILFKDEQIIIWRGKIEEEETLSTS